MSPVLILAAAWLLVIGYGLFYVGYKNQAGTKTSFADAFGLAAFTTAGQQGAPAPTQNPIQNQTASLVSA
jgi:uncharacterized membrane protein YeiH